MDRVSNGMFDSPEEGRRTRRIHRSRKLRGTVMRGVRLTRREYYEWTPDGI